MIPTPGGTFIYTLPRPKRGSFWLKYTHAYGSCQVISFWRMFDFFFQFIHRFNKQTNKSKVYYQDVEFHPSPADNPNVSKVFLEVYKQCQTGSSVHSPRHHHKYHSEYIQG